MQPSPPPWPDQPPQSPQVPQPRTLVGGTTTSRLTITLGIVSIVSLVLIVALIGTLTIVLQRGAPSGASSGELQTGAASQQTATTSSIQATSTAEGTPVPGGTGSGGSPTPKPTATPAGPPSVQILSNHLTSKSNTPITVSCPKGELALSGGWTSTVRNLPITYSKRSGNGWQVLIDTSNVGLIPTTTVYVICLQHVAGASVTERQTSRSIPLNTQGSAQAVCNSGEIVVGGGLENSGIALYSLGPDSDFSIFEVAGTNDTSTSQSLTASAECLHATKAKTTLVTPAVQTNVGARASAGLQAACPNGGLVAGGNFADNGGRVGSIYDYSPSNSSTWQAHVLNSGAQTEAIHLLPLCLSFS